MLSRASVPKQAIITQLAGAATPDLESFARQLAGLAHGAQVPLQYYVFGERHHRRTVILHIDRSWSAPPPHYKMDEGQGFLTQLTSLKSPENEPLEVLKCTFRASRCHRRLLVAVLATLKSLAALGNTLYLLKIRQLSHASNIM